MGRHDRRHSPKMNQRRRQRKVKAREARKRGPVKTTKKTTGGKS